MKYHTTFIVENKPKSTKQTKKKTGNTKNSSKASSKLQPPTTITAAERDSPLETTPASPHSSAVEHGVTLTKAVVESAVSEEGGAGYVVKNSPSEEGGREELGTQEGAMSVGGETEEDVKDYATSTNTEESCKSEN